MNDYSTNKHKPTTIDVNRNNNIIPLKRTRAKRSCDFCRKRKARCDADHTIPCSNCKAWGFNCEFLTVRKKRGPPSVYVENLETRCKKMESLLTCLTKSTIKDIERNDFRAETYLNSTNKRSVPNHHSTKEVATHDEDNDDNDDDNAMNDHDDDDDDDDDDNDDDSSFDGDDNHSEYRNNAIQKEEDESNIEETLANLNLDDYDSIKYTGLSAGLQLVDQNLFKSKSYVQLPGREHIALQLMSQNELLVVRSDPSSAPGKKPDTRLDVGFSLTSTIFDKKKSNDTWYLGNDTHASSKSLMKDLPTKSVVDKAIKLYFSHIHLFLPIVNRTRFETHDKKTSNILVQAVLAVTFRFASRHFPKLFNKKTILYADIYFKKVMTKLQSSNRARLREVQAALLMTLYLDMDETDVESMQWYTLGKAIRMAQDIGLHRSCSNWNLPRSEIETRHRVFYACYILDRLMGARAGKPLTILDRDFDTDLPVPYEVYDDLQFQPGPSIYHSFIYLIELSEILGRVLKALYAPKSKHSNSNAGLDDPTILAVFDRRLKNWKTSLDQPKDGIKLSQAQKVNLLLFYYTVMLLLHRPFIEFSSDATTKNVIHGSVDLDHLARESRQACENAASSISVIVRQKQSLMSDPDSYSPLCLPTCFVYSMFQSSLIHLAIAIKNRDSLRRLRLLQRSIGLLKQHEQLSSCQRAHRILVMLVTINGINLDNLLENDTTKEEDIIHDNSIMQQSPNLATKNHKELLFPSTTQTQPQQIVNRNAVIPGCESSSMPKSSWYQRMMNTSIIGGITPDLHQGLEEDGASRTLEQLLPYATDMTHHARSDSNSTLYQHNRSDSNSTLYHPQENELQPSTNYYDVVMQNTVKSTHHQNRHHDFNDAGGNLRILQCDHNSTFGHNSNVPTLLSHPHVLPPPPPFTRNNITAASGLPFSSTATTTATATAATTTNFGNLNHTTSSINNTSNTYPIHYLPPSNLNWSDWGVYLTQQNTTSTPTQHQQSSNEPSTENHLTEE